jgi:hypothetical protein
MSIRKWFSGNPVRMLAVVSLILIVVVIVVTSCVPANVTQTASTPAPPLTNLQSISPQQPQKPTASPTAASKPSISPSADAIIPSPSGPPAPSPSETPSPIPSESSGPSASASPASITINLTAQNLAFDKKTITVPTGANVTINFNNKDTGIENNFSIYLDQAATNPAFIGGSIIGPQNITYSFTAPAQTGVFIFRSDNHPDSMIGQFIVQ